MNISGTNIHRAIAGIEIWVGLGVRKTVHVHTENNGGHLCPCVLFVQMLVLCYIS